MWFASVRCLRSPFFDLFDRALILRAWLFAWLLQNPWPPQGLTLHLKASPVSAHLVLKTSTAQFLTARFSFLEQGGCSDSFTALENCAPIRSAMHYADAIALLKSGTPETGFLLSEGGLARKSVFPRHGTEHAGRGEETGEMERFSPRLADFLRR